MCDYNLMIVAQSEFDKVKTMIEKSKSVLVCINNRSTFDTHIAALALYLSLRDLGLNPSICVNGKLIAKHRKFFEAHEVQYEDSIKPRSYVISLDHAGGEIEKVSYDDKNGKFNLYITPSEGSKAFDFDKVKYSGGGAEYDMIFVFGAKKLTWLGNIYNENKELFAEDSIVSINNIEGKSDFGAVKLVDCEVPVSHIVYELIKTVSSSASADNIVDLLLKGVLDHLQLLQINDYKISTIEALTSLVKNGADLKMGLNSIYFQKDFENFQVIQKVMSNLKYDQDKDVIWSSVSAFDFSSCGLERDDFELDGRIIFNTCVEFKAAFVLYEIADGEVWIEFESNDPNIDAKELMSEFKASGDSSRVVAVITGKVLGDIEQDLLGMLSGRDAKPSPSIEPKDIKIKKKSSKEKKNNSARNGLISLPPISPST
ncbi:MAG: hypothetical protein U9Q67_01990 [Patescibacteria group bacterium]|nr:hypothetical protein [Patescibacteria group bacterium]